VPRAIELATYERTSLASYGDIKRLLKQDTMDTLTKLDYPRRKQASVLPSKTIQSKL
jgi:hypothetical protein